MKNKKAKITKRIVDALKPGEIVWDTEIKGFGIRCQTQTKTYILKKTIKGRQRWLTIGAHGAPYTPEKAREKVNSFLGQIADGLDPAKDRDDTKKRLTVSELCDRFIDDYAVHHKKPGSVKMDRLNIKNHIKPLLGRELVEDLDIETIDRFKRDVKEGKSAKGLDLPKGKRIGPQGGPGVANRCLALLSKMINLAIRWGIRKDGVNPVRFVDKYKERKIERYLSEQELVALGAALKAAEEKGEINPFALAAIRLLMFTGARKGEILTLRWDYVDFEKGMIRLPTSKTGAKTIYLNAPAKEILTDFPRLENNPHVFCGDKPGSNLFDLKRPWKNLREAANKILLKEKLKIDPTAGEYFVGLTDLRIHDLRHTFASVAAMGGASLPIIGKLLGHTQAATTQRYAHLSDDPLKSASEAVGRRIEATMKGKKGKVVKFSE